MDFLLLTDKIVHLHLGAVMGVALPPRLTTATEGYVPGEGSLDAHVYRDLLEPFYVGKPLGLTLEIQERDYTQRRQIWRALGWVWANEPRSVQLSPQPVKEVSVEGHRALPIRLSQHVFDEAEVQAAAVVLRSPVISQGRALVKFEQDLAERCGVKHVVAFSNGTAALHAACWVAEIRSSDDVVTTPLSFVATANAILYCGGQPVFADIDPRTGNISPSAVSASLTPKTRAILIVDYAGLPCDLASLRQLAKQKGLMLIEDASHALGAQYRSKPIGGISDLTTFSFHPVKSITTGEGGAVATNNDLLADHLRVFRSHGIVRDEARLRSHEGPWYYEMQELGFNYRLNEIQSAIGSAQLEKLDWLLQRRGELYQLYNSHLQSLPLELPPTQEDSLSAYHIYPIRLQDATNRYKIFMGLRAAGVECQVHYLPIHLHPYYRDKYGYDWGMYTHAEDWYRSTISLPLHPLLTDGQVLRVCELLSQMLIQG